MGMRDTEEGRGLESTSERRDEERIHPNVYLHPSGKSCLNSSLVHVICIVCYPVTVVCRAGRLWAVATEAKETRSFF
jgi:hypothetical protein